MSARALRLVVSGSLGVALVAAGGAVAAPAKVACNLVTDAKDDTFLLRSQDGAGAFGPQEDAADIVSADVASDAKNITGVIRVKSLAAAPSTAPGGLSYDINLTSSATDLPLYIRAIVPSSGAPTAEAGSRESVVVTSISVPLGSGTVVVDKAKNEVRFSFPVALFDSVGGLKPGTKLNFGDVTTGRAAGSRAVFADVAVEGKTYAAGTKSCVVPGK
jgi:hypothetical protein